MLSAYQSSTGTFISTSGAQLSPQDVQLNILIELRVMNDMAWDAQRGAVSQTLEQYRSDAVNAVVNPVV